MEMSGLRGLAYNARRKRRVLIQKNRCVTKPSSLKSLKWRTDFTVYA